MGDGSKLHRMTDLLAAVFSRLRDRGIIERRDIQVAYARVAHSRYLHLIRGLFFVIKGVPPSPPSIPKPDA